VRAISGEKTGFAYTDEVLLPALIEASRRGARDREERWAQRGAGLAARRCTGCICRSIRSTAIRDEDKVAWLMRIDRDPAHRSARQAGDGFVGGGARGVLIASDGVLAADVRRWCA
jgi:TldD protein